MIRKKEKNTMKQKVWTVACGGYKTAGARVFTTRKEAEEYMKAEYEDQIEVSEIKDTSMCYIDDEYAEPYEESLSFDEVIVFQLEEHEIEIETEAAERSGAKWVYTYNDPLYGEEEFEVFDSEAEAEAYLISAVQKVEEFDDFGKFIKAMDAIQTSIEKETKFTGNEYADSLAYEYCMGYGCEFEGAGYADKHCVFLPETKYGQYHKWEIRQV